ncbi:hypothetical protein B0H11DRAFT_1927266 [Mycena galericulata]|nr:hypothetical protein B0H11DRAFT_1927266 [Mycena galericulata]
MHALWTAERPSAVGEPVSYVSQVISPSLLLYTPAVLLVASGDLPTSSPLSLYYRKATPFDPNTHILGLVVSLLLTRRHPLRPSPAWSTSPVLCAHPPRDRPTPPSDSTPATAAAPIPPPFPPPSQNTAHRPPTAEPGPPKGQHHAYPWHSARRIPALPSSHHPEGMIKRTLAWRPSPANSPPSAARISPSLAAAPPPPRPPPPRVPLPPPCTDVHAPGRGLRVCTRGPRDKEPDDDAPPRRARARARHSARPSCAPPLPTPRRPSHARAAPHNPSSSSQCPTKAQSSPRPERVPSLPHARLRPPRRARPRPSRASAICPPSLSGSLLTSPAREGGRPQHSRVLQLRAPLAHVPPLRQRQQRRRSELYAAERECEQALSPLPAPTPAPSSAPAYPSQITLSTSDARYLSQPIVVAPPLPTMGSFQPGSTRSSGDSNVYAYDEEGGYYEGCWLSAFNKTRLSFIFTQDAIVPLFSKRKENHQDFLRHSMSYIILSAPRQHPDESTYAEKQPFLDAFQEQEGKRLSRTALKAFIEELEHKLLNPPYQHVWWPIIQDWGKYCLDIPSLLPNLGTELFVKVLWAGSPFNLDATSQDSALNLMEKAQNKAVQSPILRQFYERCLPRKTNALEPQDNDPSDDDNSESDDSDGDWHEVPGPALVEEAEAPAGRKRARRIPFVRSHGPKRPPNTVMNSRTAGEWNRELQDFGVVEYVVEKWVQDLNLVFGWSKLEDGEKHPDAGKILQQMNGLSKRIYEQAEFRELVHTSGLELLIATVCDDSNDNALEVEMAASNRLFQWRSQLNLYWNRWTPPDTYTGIDWEQRNFLQAWEVWLGPCIRRAGTDTENWNLCRLYEDIAGIRQSDLTVFARNKKVEIPLELQRLLQLNEDFRDYLKEASKRARNPSVPGGLVGKDRRQQYNARRNADKVDRPPPPPPTADSSSQASGPILFKDNPRATARLRLDCPTCKEEQDDDKCVRIWEVDRQDVRHLKGCVISCADPKDRLEPKASNIHGVKDTTVWRTPEDLGIKEVAVRPPILERCKRDITFLVDRKTQTQKWAYGSMVAYGSRIPKGGQRGDTYRAYAHVSANTDESVEQLFDLAKTADRIRSVVETVDPDAAEALRSEAGLDPLGSTRCNLYGCNDYMSCGHWDRDGIPDANKDRKKKRTNATGKLSECLGSSLQYAKNCRADEFNFVYTEWGILVRTIPGCLWIFNARDMHQVTLPRRSTMETAHGRPMCSGSHITVGMANVDKARAILRARRLHKTTAKYWRETFSQ